jgi:hypothetical protein
MRLTYFLFAFLCLTGISLSSCQQDTGPEQTAPSTYANLFVRYIAPQGQLKVTAAFREGDSIATAQPVEIPGGVTYQGQQMEARQLPGQQVRYLLDTRSAFAKEHQFKFKAANGTTQEVTLQLAPIDSFSIIGGTASLSNGMKLYIKDERIEDGQSIVLLFSDENNKATTITLTNPAVQDTFPIAALRLRKLQPGPHRVYLVKKQHQEIDLKGTKAIADIEYYTAEQPFNVTE